MWSGEDIQLLPSVDISVAVATDGGLITPIVKEANKSSVESISSTVKVGARHISLYLVHTINLNVKHCAPVVTFTA